MEFDCGESVCWSLNGLPELPPPPPLPQFLAQELGLENSNGGFNETGDCNFCSWAGVPSASQNGSDELQLASLLIIVAIMSALVGAGATACCLSIRRLRNRKKFESSSGSIRHLTRKFGPELPSSQRPPVGTLMAMTSHFSMGTLTSTAENTYCEGPYNNENKDPAVNNIYAELNPNQTSSRWPAERPPIPPPASENCYLELNDLPLQTVKRCGKCHGHQNLYRPSVQLPLPRPLIQNQMNYYPESLTTPEGSTAAYYSDLDLGFPRTQIARCTSQPVAQPQQAIAL